jgi:hypothetical protein
MVTKKSTPKKTSGKKPTPKATAKKRPTAATTAPEVMKSFKVYRSKTPFKTLKPTRQTVYWIIILALITVAQLIILKIQLDIFELTQPLYDL